MADNTEIQTALAALAAVAGAKEQDGHPYIVLPEGYRIQDLESYLPSPKRRSGTVILRDVASFIAYVKAEAGESTRLYGNQTTPGFLAVFNDHMTIADSDQVSGSSIPGWRDYRASYSCPLSAEWKTWLGKSGQRMTQADFAQFIEDNLPDVAEPPAASMLEISRTLEAKKNVNFASGVRLDNGQTDLTYTEEITGTASKGQIKIPELFKLGIPVLEGGVRYAVDARLRYRIADGGKLQMWFDLLRAHKVLEDAVRQVWAHIEAETKLPIFNGEPK